VCRVENVPKQKETVVGGSTGGRGISLGELAALEQKAKESLRDGTTPRRNVFISFAHEDLALVNLLRGQAKNPNLPLEFNDWSLREPFNSENAKYIRAGIKERILQSSVTLVFVSDATHASEWVDWEIRESIRLGKRVVAMHGGDAPPARLPTALAEHGIKPVPWKQETLDTEINKE
jgi:MTH538 TIR-like domain (DUF1863)